jgi:hypothetical protein
MFPEHMRTEKIIPARVIQVKIKAEGDSDAENTHIYGLSPGFI